MLTTTERRILLVKRTSPPSSLASAIAHGLYEGQEVVLRAVGASAVNQTVKAIAIARKFAQTRGLDLVCFPDFVTIQIDGQEMSAIVFYVTGSEKVERIPS